MSALFHSPKTPKIAETPKPAPVPPPASSEGDNIVKEELKRKKGNKANLMTGGLGLSSIPAQNLLTHKLGGGATLGVQ